MGDREISEPAPPLGNWPQVIVIWRRYGRGLCAGPWVLRYDTPLGVAITPFGSNVGSDDVSSGVSIRAE